MALTLSRLPVPFAHFIHTRLTSTSSAPRTGRFPFPTHANPTPHEIFHLPRGASQSDIKSRYYELVRIHHPDCATARMLPSSISHSRFQAISTAYAVLLGKRPSASTWDHNAPYEEVLKRRSRARWRASAGSDEFGASSAPTWQNEDKERWDKNILVFIMAFTLSCAILPLSLLSPFTGSFTDRRHIEAQKNLANARREAREFAELRRVAMLKRKKKQKVEAPDE